MATAHSPHGWQIKGTHATVGQDGRRILDAWEEGRPDNELLSNANGLRRIRKPAVTPDIGNIG